MSEKAAGDEVWNVPNVLSMLRLVLSAVVFLLIPLGYFWSAMAVFVISALTDLLDGWWARRFNQITKLGRVLDPFCDKILICGTFVLLAEAMRDRFPWYAGFAGWMAVVVIGRELLVTALRSVVEGSGGDFSAKMAGKLKMWFQCIAAVSGLIALAIGSAAAAENGGDYAASLPPWLLVVLVVSNWAAVLSTLWSGWGYVLSAAAQFRARGPEGEGTGRGDVAAAPHPERKPGS